LGTRLRAAHLEPAFEEVEGQREEGREETARRGRAHLGSHRRLRGVVLR
jgi:hypothetical protein